MVRRETTLEAAQSRLRELISSSFNPGDKLPNERDLAEQLEVSRATVREVLGRLAAEGVIRRAWGVGTFVHDATERVPVSIGDVVALRDRITAAGHRPALQDASVTRAPCPADCAAALGVATGSPVWRVDRLFSVDEVPAAWIRDHLPLSLGGRDLDPSGMVSIDLDLFEFFADVAGQPVSRAEIDLSAVLPEPEAVVRLAVPPAHPVVTGIQTGYATNGDILFHGHITVRTDVLTLRITRGG